MHRGLPSFTALFVAGARAVSSRTSAASCSARDDEAHDVMPPAVTSVLHVLETGAERSRVSTRALAWLSLGLIDHLALRTRAIDAVVVGAAERGVDQLVILGAGLDTRAHRLRELQRTRVFEVDHPPTQAGKRERAEHMPLSAASVTYVPVDFSRDALDEALRAHGHDAARQTCFVWEGVTPYLTEEAATDTLRKVRVSSAPGSEIAITYAPVSLLRARALILGAMRVLGEPLHFLPERAELAALLSREGFDVVSDTHTGQWRKQYGERRNPGPAVTFERLCVARAR